MAPFRSSLKKLRAGGLALAVACAIGAAAAAPPPTQASAAELERLRGRIQALQQKLERDQGQHDELRGQLEDSERRIADIAVALGELKRQMHEQAAKVRQTQAARSEAEQGLAAQNGALARQLRAAYVIGQRGKTKLVLSQTDTLRFTRVLTYYDYLNRTRILRIQDIRQHVVLLRSLEDRLRQETAQLESLRARQQGALEALQAGRLDRARMLAAIETRIRNESQELKQLQANELELQRLLESLRDALADIPLNLGKTRPFARQKGRLPWPLRGTLLARYGDAKAAGKLKWNGLWIAGQSGDVVRAVARGRVAYVGWMHRYGLIVILEHEGGYYSLYGHNQTATRSVGEWVNPGDALATVGDSGGHERPGLYFELRKGAEPVDPKPWLTR